MEFSARQLTNWEMSNTIYHHPVTWYQMIVKPFTSFYSCQSFDVMLRNDERIMKLMPEIVFGKQKKTMRNVQAWI